MNSYARASLSFTKLKYWIDKFHPVVLDVGWFLFFWALHNIINIISFYTNVLTKLRLEQFRAVILVASC